MERREMPIYKYGAGNLKPDSLLGIWLGASAGNSGQPLSGLRAGGHEIVSSLCSRLCFTPVFMPGGFVVLGDIQFKLGYCLRFAWGLHAFRFGQAFACHCQYQCFLLKCQCFPFK